MKLAANLRPNHLSSSSFSRHVLPSSFNELFPAGQLRVMLSRTWSRSLSCAAKNHSPVCLEQQEEFGVDLTKVTTLKQKIEVLGIDCEDSCVPGRYNLLFCPKCKDRQSQRRTLSLHIIQDGRFAMWRCFHSDCGWAGQAYADSSGLRKAVNKVSSFGQMTVESLGLEPLSDKVIAYFDERKISVETLQRNAVMQLSSDMVRGGQDTIAFTYRQNDQLVGCKYRTLGRRFWQERGTEKFLYGLNDITDADEIIIVEGETDKLSVEEAGLFNCVSVPGGAPGKVSTKPLPPSEKDSAFQYIWKCKEYLDKASRIILATDDDKPGHALAEELARRLGKERCWRVNWPRKDELSCYKDANEVLKNLGPAALKEVIESAELDWGGVVDAEGCDDNS